MLNTVVHMKDILAVTACFLMSVAIDVCCVVLRQMLSTVLNIIMFEDCRNQWSMSRPLLGLILLNEEVSVLFHCASFLVCLLNPLSAALPVTCILILLNDIVH